MPLLMPCNELRPGMRLAEPVRQGGRTLLSGGKHLNPKDIVSLRKRFPDLVVSVVDPILDEIVEFEDCAREARVAETVSSRIARAMSEVRVRYAERASLSGVHVSRLQEAIADVLRYLEQNPTSTAVLTRILDNNGYLARHTGNVFYLTMLLGTSVRDYISRERARDINARGVSQKSMLDLTPLGIGAAFIDVGMLPLQHLYEQRGPLTVEQLDQVRRHPLVGADLLPADFSVLARAVVKTHHENFDGCGYPQGLGNTRLHVFTRIVRIADAFDAATSTHVYQKAKSPARALWEMTKGPYRRFYDPVLMQVFGRLIQPFPIGAKLRLADGRYAVVVRYNRKNPFQPYVIIAFDRDGRRLPNERLDGPFGLHERPNLHVGSFAGEDLSYAYGSGGDWRDARSREQRTLFEAMYP